MSSRHLAAGVRIIQQDADPENIGLFIATPEGHSFKLDESMDIVEVDIRSGQDALNTASIIIELHHGYDVRIGPEQLVLSDRQRHIITNTINQYREWKGYPEYDRPMTAFICVSAGDASPIAVEIKVMGEYVDAFIPAKQIQTVIRKEGVSLTFITDDAEEPWMPTVVDLPCLVLDALEFIVRSANRKENSTDYL